jgi:hypothetical protein
MLHIRMTYVYVTIQDRNTRVGLSPELPECLNRLGHGNIIHVQRKEAANCQERHPS